MPTSWWGHIYVDLGRQATHGCGDLIFSSHTTFVLVGVLTFTEYGQTLLIKVIAWIGVAAMGLCIIASRKHYTVDVVVAWYTVPLVFYAMLRRWTTKRPVQDYWPHRPLAGEEGQEPAAVEAAALDATKSVDGKPLLPVVLAPGHSRQSSRSTTDLRSLGKPPLPPVKEPASPPPEASPNGVSNGNGIVAAVAGGLRANGVPRPQRRQNSSSSVTLNGHVMEVELRDLETGGAANESSPMLPQRSHRERDSSPSGSSPSGQNHQECAIM